MFVANVLAFPKLHPAVSKSAHNYFEAEYIVVRKIIKTGMNWIVAECIWVASSCNPA